MNPSDVVRMRDLLSKKITDSFGGRGFDLSHDRQELADWLIGSGWVKEARND